MSTKRISKPTIKASKMTVAQILSYTPNKLSKLKKADLYEIARRGASLAEQRRKSALSALERNPNMAMPMVYGDWTIQDTNAKMKKGTPKGVQSYRYIDFSVRESMKLNELRAQMYYIRNFLNSKTSTFGDWKKFRKEFKSGLEEAIKEEYGLSEKPILKYLTKAQTDLFWKAYNAMKDSDYTGYSSTQIQAMLYQDIIKRKNIKYSSYNDMDIGYIIEPLKDRLRTGYEIKKQVLADVSTDPLDLGSNE